MPQTGRIDERLPGPGGGSPIVYTIDDDSRIVRVFRIRPRGDAYR
jgi:hypothetical protein